MLMCTLDLMMGSCTLLCVRALGVWWKWYRSPRIETLVSLSGIDIE